MDTQIVESFDTSGLIDNLMLPMLLGGAWGFALSDQSTPGFRNIVNRLIKFQAAGVTPERMMIGFNRMLPDTTFDTDTMRRQCAAYATYVGSVPSDPAIARSLEDGRPPGSGPYAAMVDSILYPVTGLDLFAPKPEISRTTKNTRGLLRRLVPDRRP